MDWLHRLAAQLQVQTGTHTGNLRSLLAWIENRLEQNSGQVEGAGEQISDSELAPVDAVDGTDLDTVTTRVEEKDDTNDRCKGERHQQRVEATHAVDALTAQAKALG